MPDWKATASVVGSGSFSSSGLESHGTTAPMGAGHGSDSFAAGHRFTSGTALKPTSMVLETVK